MVVSIFFECSPRRLDGKLSNSITPRKINIKPENNGSEHVFPYPGVFSGSMLLFRGVILFKWVETTCHLWIYYYFSFCFGGAVHPELGILFLWQLEGYVLLLYKSISFLSLFEIE